MFHMVMDKNTKPADDNALSVFISYSRRDMEQADAIVDALEEQGMRVTIDKRDLPYGEEWQDELADFIRTSDTVIWLVSPHSVSSRWCNWELGEVQRLNKRLIPVAVGVVDPDTLPEALGKIHILPVGTTFNLEKHLSDLITTLNTDRRWLKDHTRLSDRAQQWQLKDKSKDLLLMRSALADAEDWRDRQPASAPEPSDKILDLILQSNRAQSRRQKWITTLAITVAAGALGLSALAFWQQQVAVAERNRAEQTLRTATRTANRMVSELALKFKKTSVPGPIVRSILEEAKGLQDTLIKSFPDDVDLQKSQAAALTDLGEIYLQQENLTKAEEIHQQALRIRRKLWTRDKTNTQSGRNVPVSLNRLGDVKQRAGDMAASLKYYEEGLSILRTLVVGQENNNTQWQRDLSVSLEKIGNMKLLKGDATGAKTAYDEMLAIRRKLNSQDKTNLQWRADLSIGLEKIGNLKLRAGQQSAALQAYEESLAIVQALRNEEKSNPAWQSDAAAKLNRIGDIKQQAKDTTGALQAYEKSLAINRQLAQQDKTNAKWQRGVFVSLIKIGDVELRLGHTNAALDKFQQCQTITQSLTTRDQTNTQWQRDLSVTFERLGDVKLLQKQRTVALTSYQNSLAIRRKLAALEENNTNWQRDLSVILNKIGNVKMRNGDTGGAIAAFESSLKIDRKLAARDKTNIRWQLDLVISLAKLAQAGAHPQQNYTQAITILKKLKENKQLGPDQIKWIGALEKAQQAK